MNGHFWQKAALGLVALLASIALAWTASQSEGDAKQDTHITAAEENIRTIHYEAQVQRRLLKRIGKAVGAEVDDIGPVRPLREVD